MQSPNEILNESNIKSNVKTIPNEPNQEKNIEESDLNQKQNENSNLGIKGIKEEKEISSIQSNYFNFNLIFLEPIEPNLTEQNKESKQKTYFVASHIPNEKKKVSFNVTKRYNHSTLNNSTNHIEKNQNINHKFFASQISNFDFVQKNQNKKQFISNNNLPMNGNFTMNIPIINKSAISSEEIIKKNQEKSGYCYLSEKNYQNFIQDSPFLKNDSNNDIENNNNKNIPNPNVKNPKFKDNYIELLVNSAESLIKNGLNLNSLKQYNPEQNDKISYSYSHNINLKKIPHNQNQNPSSTNNNGNNNNQNNQKEIIHKCENKICPVSFSKNSSIHKTKAFSLKNHILNLCNQCYQAYKNGQFCYYCGTIYREYKGKKGFNEHKSWIACDYCKNWEHIQCEEEFGSISHLSHLIKDNKYKYKCPICRKKDKNFLKNKSSKPQTSDETEEDLSTFVKKAKKKKIDFTLPSGKKDKNYQLSELYSDLKQIYELDK